MRKLLLLVATGVLVLGIAGQVNAAPLNWSGTMTLQLGTLPPLTVTGGGVATVNGSLGGIPAHLQTLRLKESRGNLGGNQVAIVTDPDVILDGIAAVGVTATLGTGTFSPISGAASSSSQLFKNVLPVRGLAKICIISTTCDNFLPLELTQPTTNGARFPASTTNTGNLTPAGQQGKKLGIPGTGTKGLGIGGLLTIGGESPIRVSIEAAPWTIKTRTLIDQTDDNDGNGMSFHNVTRAGFVHSPASQTTSTAQPSGVVQLISPMQVVTNITSGSNEKIALFGILTIHFVPEPGMLLLIGSGVAGLALLGRRRMRK